MDNDKLEKIWQDLKTQRDELKVQAHLAKAELKDEWEELEDRFESAQDKLDEIRREGVATAGEVKHGMDIVLEEMGEAYRRMKRRMKEE